MREIFEETGHVIEDPGPCIWRRRKSITDAAGVTRASDERYFWCSVSSAELTRDNLNQYERTYIQEFRWWSIDDPDLRRIRIFPEDFTDAAGIVLRHGRRQQRNGCNDAVKQCAQRESAGQREERVVEQGQRGPADLDARQIAVRVGDDEILVSWHAPNMPPEGETHGAEGVCVTDTADVVVISRNGRRWELPTSRPERGETWEQTLRR